MLKKLSIAVLYLGIAYVIYVNGDALLTWFREDNNVILVMVMATLMALFPVIPYPIVGGVIGAAFGPVLGGSLTWVGSSAASILMFLFVRYGYQQWAIKLLHRYSSVGKLTEMFERNAFLTILFSRLIPIIPSIVVNVYSAVSRVSFGVYAVASLLGKVPSMLLFAVVGDSLMTEPGNMLISIAIYGGFLLVTLSIYSRWKKNKALSS
ncbi:TVP38/TMEM64 family protein [Paenibacillus abyssi]|uniref:TVP38/TMEM64 family membrane protein n=1 Tax=Paenibacillus abyssi TaxID=1340531 RepID=A0A917CP13_9BACL|nr:TVP38/TMEM64 family protein [Paenibacillus abyssi]GGF92983.1 hypothetical protein GCM10010916_07920 [Paenibacillus abyssi]